MPLVVEGMEKIHQRRDTVDDVGLCCIRFRFSHRHRADYGVGTSSRCDRRRACHLSLLSHSTNLGPTDLAYRLTLSYNRTSTIVLHLGVGFALQGSVVP